jgi:hypothetical protein
MPHLLKHLFILHPHLFILNPHPFHPHPPPQPPSQAEATDEPRVAIPKTNDIAAKPMIFFFIDLI